jgi:hypothetical protein
MCIVFTETPVCENLVSPLSKQVGMSGWRHCQPPTRHTTFPTATRSNREFSLELSHSLRDQFAKINNRKLLSDHWGKDEEVDDRFKESEENDEENEGQSSMDDIKSMDADSAGDARRLSH